MPTSRDQNGVFGCSRKTALRSRPSCCWPATYIMHVAFWARERGEACSDFRVVAARETFGNLPAADFHRSRVGTPRFRTPQISFDIYKGSQFGQSERRRSPPASCRRRGAGARGQLFTSCRNTATATRWCAHDVRVQAGKLTDIIVTHRAAQICSSWSAPRRRGARHTDWAVSRRPATPSRIQRRVPARDPAEGEYKVIARQRQQGLSAGPHVIPGVDGEIEVRRAEARGDRRY